MGCAVSKSGDKEIEYNVEEQDLTSLPFASIPKNVSKITCANNKIKELPAELSTLSTLKEIDASTNALTTIPADFSTSESIEKLLLFANKIKELPATLPPNLTELNLFNNLIKKLPPSIGDLAKLEEVNIAANKLMMTTDAMFVKWSAVTVLNLYDNNLVRFGSLVNCVSLTELRLSGNALEAMPTLSSHPSLKIFEMHKNRVSVIPDAYFEATPSLERLSLWGNMLTAVPTSLLSCVGLLGVQLQENKIEALPGGPYPPRLETLFLHDNLLTTLPQGLKRCFALKRVNVAKLNLDEAGTDVAEAMKAICIQPGTSGIFWDKSGVQHKSA